MNNKNSNVRHMSQNKVIVCFFPTTYTKKLKVPLFLYIHISHNTNMLFLVKNVNVRYSSPSIYKTKSVQNISFKDL